MMELVDITTWGALVFLVLVIIFYRRIKELKRYMFNDALDFILSFADEAYGGGSMLDIGDWAAAIIILVREWKHSGKRVALIVAIEAAIFIPGLDFLANIIPTSMLIRILGFGVIPGTKKEETYESPTSETETDGEVVQHFSMAHADDPNAIDDGLANAMVAIDDLAGLIAEAKSLEFKVPDGASGQLEAGIASAEQFIELAKTFMAVRNVEGAMTYLNQAKKTLLDAKEEFLGTAQAVQTEQYPN